MYKIFIFSYYLCVQEQSLSNQNQLIKNGQELQNQLHSAQQEVSTAFTNIQQQAGSFKEQFNQVSVNAMLNKNTLGVKKCEAAS